MRTFIVDDEPKIRSGLVNIIKKFRPSWPEPGSAANGMEALNTPDFYDTELLFLDIQMPEMDAFALLDAMGTRREAMQVVIVTGYANFSYAQKSVRYRVVDYLLKPIDINQIREIIRHAEANHDTYLQRQFALRLTGTNLEDMQEKLFSTLVYENREYTREQLAERLGDLSIRDGPCSVIVLRQDQGLDKGWAPEQGKELKQELQIIISKHASGFVLVGSTSFVLVVQWEAAESCQLQLGPLLRDLEQSRVGRSCTIGASPCHHLLLEVNQAYREARHSISMKNSKQEKIAAYLPGDKTGYVKSLLTSRAKYHPAVQAAIDYVTTHYKDQIKVEQIASVAYVNTSYLSELFKKETGHNLSSFIVDYRLSLAKRDLQKLENKVFMVADNVGFSNQRYFSHVFHKQVGITPQEYKDLYYKESGSEKEVL